MISRYYSFLKAAASNVLRYGGRSMVVILCLLAILFPFITAIAISEGVKSQALVSVDEAADIYVTLDQYGQNAAIPAKFAEEIRHISGVVKAVPRVVGRTYFVDKLVVVVGISPENIPASVRCVEGSLFKEREDVIIGAGLAEYFKLGIGERFSLELNPQKLFKVVGLFDAQASIWSSNLLFMSFEDANELFRMEGMATDILVYTRPGYEESVSEVLIAKQESDEEAPLFRIQTKKLVRQYFLRGYNLKEGIFTALYIIAFALGIPAFLVASGFGLTERRREIGVLKATGWQTQEVLNMVFFENILISLASASLAIIVAYLWLKVFNGVFIAQIFIAEIGLFPKFSVPARFLPLPALLSFLLALVLTMVGSIYSTWRTAIIPPAQAMRG
ncbi:MAG: ABC transporter permease [bacterium]